MCGLLIKDSACVAFTVGDSTCAVSTPPAARRRRPPPPAGPPDHENRPDRYGFNFRSRPRVVDGPCPGYTCMESG